MTFAEIKELLADGFTPEQITLLTTSGAAPTPAPAAAPGEETAPDNPLPVDTPDAISESSGLPPAAAISPAAAPAPEAEPVQNPNKDVLDAISDLKKSIQAGNILRNSIDTVDPDNALEKAMAEIIRPSFDKHE